MNLLEENENPIIWKNNILKSLIDLSDIEFQKILWLGKSPNYASSFIEMINTLFDTNDIERFVKYYKSVKGEDDLYKKMNKLIHMIDNFKEPKTDEIILKDPKWLRITLKAKGIVNDLIEANI